jgi:hypothetical protein
LRELIQINAQNRDEQLQAEGHMTGFKKLIISILLVTGLYLSSSSMATETVARGVLGEPPED